MFPILSIKLWLQPAVFKFKFLHHRSKPFVKNILFYKTYGENISSIRLIVLLLLQFRLKIWQFALFTLYWAYIATNERTVTPDYKQYGPKTKYSRQNFEHFEIVTYRSKKVILKRLVKGQNVIEFKKN